MIRLNEWKQLNNSDKTGTIWASKNINLDKPGEVRLSPRTILIAGEDLAPDQGTLGDFNLPTFIGRVDSGEYLVATTDDFFNVRNNITTKAVNKNSTDNPPDSGASSHGLFWQNLFVASGATQVASRAVSTDYTASWTTRISSLSVSFRMPLCVFQSRNELCVGVNNVVKQYNTSWSGTTDLTLPSTFNVVKIAYNNQLVGVATRLGSTTQGANIDAHFFVWDGATTSATRSAGVNSDACLDVCAYKSSFVVLTRAGQLLYWNGAGFDVLASFPVWYDDKFLSAGQNNTIFKNVIAWGDVLVPDGDIIYINMPNLVEPFGYKREQIISNFPHGVWCYDGETRNLYHRYSPSRSPAYMHSITAGNVNTTTDVITTSSTIPATGNPVKITNFAGSIGGLVLNKVYFVIKVSSTTFKLATSKANADAGTAIDLTSVSNTTTMWMYDVIDYAQTVSRSETGALCLVGETTATQTDILIGSETYNTTIDAKDSLAVGVPLLENRGYFITSKIFSNEITDVAQNLVVKFRPLKSTDQIIVKYRSKEIDGLPVASTGNPDLADRSADWGNARSFTTPQDLSEAKTYFDAGGELELEIVAGAGAGVMEKITDIHAEGSGYSVSVGNDVIGASSGTESEYIINNWEVKRTITSSDSDILNNYVVIPLGGSASWMQFKIELRGSETTVEELQLISSVDQQAV